ncbi:neurofilament medium polypeptide [Bactrocera dorsalis]|uniref:Neurofilament medium polypeptide n=1 Tax=Bactrocera dorsalis TaxID=27457 RepID=A0A6I9UVD1_BACDO|nr:neurofilament medium polypeptide [Bactrocera dorsalis]
MRSFIIICLLATAFADKLGYNYQPVPHSAEGLSFTPGALSIAAHHGVSPLSSEKLAPVAHTPVPLAPVVPAPVVPAPVAPVPVALAPIGPAPNTLAPVAHVPIAPAPVVPAPVAPAPVGPAPNTLAPVAPAPVASAPVAPAPVQVEYEKEFYTYTAPQEESNDGADLGNIANSLKKNLRVIFIRAPENKALENAAVSLAKQTTEEKTAIYVLTKQADIGSLAQKLQNIGTQSSSKPEVHFVKYRTPQDAENAQQAIQQQYESLPGSSRHSNGGSAQVLNFASQASATAAPAPAAPGTQYLPANAVPSQEYLPSSFRRFRN